MRKKVAAMLFTAGLIAGFEIVRVAHLFHGRCPGVLVADIAEGAGWKVGVSAFFCVVFVVLAATEKQR
jgi:hypothetical protein